MNYPSFQFLDATSKFREETDLETTDRKKTGHERVIICKSCGHMITSESAKIMVNNSHVHTFMNPSGIVYTFGCFQDAPGIIAAGIATSEYTWFPGYSWQILICANCREHLGWMFRNGDTFFALIVGKLTNYSS